MHSRDQTIFALSSGRPPSAIAVVRISGSAASQALIRLAGKLPVTRMGTFATLRDGSGHPIDEAVVLWFPAPNSATGEDVAELQVHGSRAVIAALFDTLAKIDTLRPAEPGEFTQRAFENGKLDLTEAEGLDDLIHADTDMQRRVALRQLKGLLGKRAEHWRQQLIDAAALIEAGIDFSDEGDVPDDAAEAARARIEALRDEIAEVLAAQGQSERLRDGLVVAIAGPPNAGKSTLINRLARRDIAIVSPIPGTTRDALEVHLDLSGYPVTLIDTAGIRDSVDPIEREGVRRARARAGEADLVLWMTDATQDTRDEIPMSGSSQTVWRVRNKCDEFGNKDCLSCDRDHAISALTGKGVDELIAALGRFASTQLGGEGSLITRARHRTLLLETWTALGAALGSIGKPELAAEELRRAIHSLGRLLGKIDVEDVLGSIFKNFCIGK